MRSRSSGSPARSARCRPSPSSGPPSTGRKRRTPALKAWPGRDRRPPPPRWWRSAAWCGRRCRARAGGGVDMLSMPPPQLYHQNGSIEPAMGSPIRPRSFGVVGGCLVRTEIRRDRVADQFWSLPTSRTRQIPPSPPRIRCLAPAETDSLARLAVRRLFPRCRRPDRLPAAACELRRATQLNKAKGGLPGWPSSTSPYDGVIAAQPCGNQRARRCGYACRSGPHAWVPVIGCMGHLAEGRQNGFHR
jgi:hypothetical protein